MDILHFDECRGLLLSKALADTKKWCVSPSERVDRSRRSDQYWIKLFSEAGIQAVTETDAHDFLVSFRLTNRVKWIMPAVTKAINEACVNNNFASAMNPPDIVVEALSRKLKECNTRRSQQTSAASKILMFAKPGDAVFIWDRLASRSARWRDWTRQPRSAGRSKPRVGLYARSGRQHDYATYWKACKSALDEERRREDFRQAAADLGGWLREVDGPMSSAPRDFVERRLLDKLMFWEGHCLHRGVNHVPQT